MSNELDWKVYENFGGDREADVVEMNNTDYADAYLGRHGTTAVIPCDKNLVWTVIPVLEFLNGRPWNNVALNYVMGLRPSTIRVTAGEVAADSYTWRVTVHLELDGRTVKHIEQEVQTMGVGCRYGADLKLHLGEYRDKPVLSKEDFPLAPRAIVNMNAVKTLNLSKEKAQE